MIAHARRAFERWSLRREYNAVMSIAAMLGRDAGEEMYCLAHMDDAPPKAPDGSLWMPWDPAMPAKKRDHAMMFNAQMSFATARAEGFAQAFQIDVMDKVHQSLREAA
jgi:hypothetical protein